MTKKIFIFSIILIAVFGVIKEAKAGATDNVWGWAWAENIGWISFNCLNDYDGDGTNESHCTDAGYASNYGVNIDPSTGLFSDYAWSRGADATGGIGWIRFDPPADFVTYPVNGYPDADYPYPACIDLPGVSGQACEALNNYEVGGWARACAGTANPDTTCDGAANPTAGGWEGWIKLRGAVQGGGIYGATLDATITPNEFRGWAWGGDETATSEAVIGWISFNCIDGGYNEVTGESYSVCGTSNYKVMADINLPPYVVSGSPNITGSEYCAASPQGQISFQWTYNDNEGDSQSQYNLQIATDSGFSNLVVDATADQSVSPPGSGTTAVVVQSPTAQISDLDIGYTGSGTTYYWRVRVKAGTGNLEWSGWQSGPTFQTPAAPYPKPNFTHCPSNPRVGDTIQFCSVFESGVCEQGFCSNMTSPADNLTTCTAGCSSSDWKSDGVSFSSLQNATHDYSIIGGKTVRLKVTDTNSNSCYKERPLTIRFPLPRWREISPF